MPRMSTESTLVALWMKLEAAIAQMSLAAAMGTPNGRFILIKAILGGMAGFAAMLTGSTTRNILSEQFLGDFITSWVKLFRHKRSTTIMGNVFLCEFCYFWLNFGKLFREKVC